MGSRSMSLGAAIAVAFFMQVLPASLFLWYAKFPVSVFCREEDDEYGFIPVLPDCPEPRPYVPLMGAGCFLFAVIGSTLPAVVLRPSRRQVYAALVVMVSAPLALVAGAIVALYPSAIIPAVIFWVIALFSIVGASLAAKDSDQRPLARLL